MSLGQSIAGGAAWTVAGRLAIRMLGFISTIILARLLVPEDFGLVAQAMMVVGFLDMATEFGIHVPLIQNQKATRDHYDSGWTLQILRGIVVAAVLVLLAPATASYLREPRLEQIIYALSLMPLIYGFVNIGIVDFRKHFQFDKDFRLNIIKKVVGFVTVISLAVIWKNYWAFVISNIVANVAIVLASYAMSPYRPKISFVEWRSLFHFSKWVWARGVLNAANDRIDLFLLSRFTNVTTVGTFTLSREVATTPSSELAMPIARALFPGLSKVADDPEEFRRILASVFSVTLMIALPAGAGLSYLAEPLTLVLLGEKWVAAIPFIQILAAYGVIKIVSSFAVVTLNAMHRPQVNTYLAIAIFAVRLSILPFLVIRFGAIGLCYGLVISALIEAIVTIATLAILKVWETRTVFHQTWRTIIATIVMLFSLTLIESAGQPFLSAGVLPLLGLTLVGAVTYFTSIQLMWILSGRPHGPEEAAWSLLQNIRSQNLPKVRGQQR